MNREMMANTRVVWLSLLAVLLAGCSAWSKVIYVDDDAVSPGDGTSWATAYRYLQDALTDAETAEEPVEIRVAQGLYKPDLDAANPQGTGEYPWEISFRLEDGMSLLGGYAGVNADDPNARDFEAYETVLSGDLEGNDAEVTDAALLRDDTTRDENTWEVVYIHGDRVLLEGCTITGGTAGGVEVYGSDIIVRDCVFRGNRGNEVDAQPSAGGLTAFGKNQLIVRCSFIGNAGYMGAARADGESFEGCLFWGNYGWGRVGGAVKQYGGTFTDCVFTENRAKGSGGALCMDSGECTLTRCVFRDNVAGRGGGGLDCGGPATITDCVFVGNESAGRGGGLAQGGTLSMANCLFVGNRAGAPGGAISKGSGYSTICNCTFTANRAPSATFLYRVVQSGVITISDCIISNSDTELWTVGQSEILISHSNLLAGEAAIYDPEGLVIWGEGNIEADPCFVDPGYWDDNGTADDPNDDFFIEGDYHLKSQAGRWDEAGGSWVADNVTSPCIDAGDPNSAIGCEPFPNGGIVNMGAYGGTAEASKSYFGQPLCETVIAGDLNGDCIVDMADLAILVRHWLETGQ